MGVKGSAHKRVIEKVRIDADLVEAKETLHALMQWLGAKEIEDPEHPVAAYAAELLGGIQEIEPDYMAGVDEDDDEDAAPAPPAPEPAPTPARATRRRRAQDSRPDGSA